MAFHGRSGSLVPLLSAFLYMRVPLPAYADMTQKGSTIMGNSTGDRFGQGLALSSDGKVLAIGAPYDRSEFRLKRFGYVRVYSWSNGNWTQRGSDIDGKKDKEYAGDALALSSDGTILAVGAPGAGNPGLVRVYEWNGNAWTQRGSDLNGENTGDQFGSNLDLTPDGTTLAVSAHTNDFNGNNAGRVYVYVWSAVSSTWTPKGSPIHGVADKDLVGANDGLALSSNGQILAIGAQWNNGNGVKSGAARVFEWNSSHWTQKGSDIQGEAAGDYAGMSVALNSNGTIFAVGAPRNAGNGTDSGHVRVYHWENDAWIQRGANIVGEAAGDRSGSCMDMSSDGVTLAIGAPQNGGRAGHVRVYNWKNGAWTQEGPDIDGDASLDSFGDNVVLSSDGTILAVSAPGAGAGHGRVFEDPITTVTMTNTTGTTATLTATTETTVTDTTTATTETTVTDTTTATTTATATLTATTMPTKTATELSPGAKMDILATSLLVTATNCTAARQMAENKEFCDGCAIAMAKLLGLHTDYVSSTCTVGEGCNRRLYVLSDPLPRNLAGSPAVRVTYRIMAATTSSSNVMTSLNSVTPSTFEASLMTSIAATGFQGLMMSVSAFSQITTSETYIGFECFSEQSCSFHPYEKGKHYKIHKNKTRSSTDCAKDCYADTECEAFEILSTSSSPYSCAFWMHGACNIETAGSNAAGFVSGYLGVLFCDKNTSRNSVFASMCHSKMNGLKIHIVLLALSVFGWKLPNF